MTPYVRCLAFTLALLCGSITAAHAVPITYTFTGTFGTGALAGQPFTGSFSYDTAGNGFVQTNQAGFLDPGSDPPLTSPVSVLGVGSTLTVTTGGSLPFWALILNFATSLPTGLLSGPLALNAVSGSPSVVYLTSTGSPSLSTATAVSASVPEPGTLILLGSGLAGLGLWRGRRRPLPD